MISIFTTKDTLESFCKDKKRQAWLNILLKLKEVFINDDITYSDNTDPEDDFFCILEGMQVTIETKEKEYINNIGSNPKSVLEHPNSIFILNISDEMARRIQEDYGVICQSIIDPDCYQLTQPHFPTELEEGESGKSWEGMIGHYKIMPSNSILIIDAHLFDNDRYNEKKKCYDEKQRFGIDNLCAIISCILPESFNETYHIGVFLTNTDEAKKYGRSHTNLTNELIASSINKLKKRLKRDYAINTEVVFINPSDNSGHKLIHNRRILSNYYVVTADYKLAALNNGVSRESQTIDACSLFENIDIDTKSDKKEKRVKRDLEQLQTLIKRQVKNPTAVLFQNGKKQNDFSELEHRLLKCF